jgi:hypothetical protein
MTRYSSGRVTVAIPRMGEDRHVAQLVKPPKSRGISSNLIEDQLHQDTLTARQTTDGLHESSIVLGPDHDGRQCHHADSDVQGASQGLRHCPTSNGYKADYGANDRLCQPFLAAEDRLVPQHMLAASRTTRKLGRHTANTRTRSCI